jgi:RNA 2',3'-cyclic 3'-phosphodiesterase
VEEERPLPDETLRTFIAIELDETLHTALKQVQDKLKHQSPAGSVKWVAPDGIHLTLKFLGDTLRGRLAEIEAALDAACAGLSPFEFSVAGCGCFPNTRRPRVVWVAVRDHGSGLARLHAAVELHIVPLGWPREKRAFSPHLTLGRIKRSATNQDATMVGQVVARSVIEQIGRQRVTALSLIRSDLRPSGAVYTELARMPLGQ